MVFGRRIVSGGNGNEYKRRNSRIDQTTLLTNMGRLVAIDSQLGTPAEGMPFGEGPAKVLEEALKIADELGFKTVNLDNYCGYAEMGEGEEIVGIAGHLDIVPVGGDWTYDPFTLTQ